jgi:hypothetical protein
MRKISIYETVLCYLTIYWKVTYSFVVVIYMPSYKLLGIEHCITDGGERGGFGIHICREKNVSPSFRKKCNCLSLNAWKLVPSKCKYNLCEQIITLY